MKKVILRICACFTVAFSLFLLTCALASIREPELSCMPFTAICVVVELVFVIICTSIYTSVYLESHTKRKFKTFFLWMLFLTTVGLLSDVVYWGIGLNFIPFFPVIQEACYYFCYATAFPLLVFFSTYLISFINEDEKDLKYYATLVGGLSADGVILVVLSAILAHSPKTPWLLSEHQWFYFVFLALPLSVMIGIILIFRRMLSNRKALSFLFYALLVFASIILDVRVGNITTAYVVTAFSLIQIYITVQIEYEKQQEQILVQQRIAIMLSQIQPHFLYNALTSIRALCASNPQKAEKALTDFTIYLRGNLNSLKKEDCIPFLEELEHTRHYVDLEKMRYGKSLQVLFNTPVTQFDLPPLSLEPLVENAVRHGVMRRKSGGTVMILSEEGENAYQIIVADNGVGFDPSTPCAGDHVGLENVQERLMSMCGGNLEINSVPGKGTTVVISIPKGKGK